MRLLIVLFMLAAFTLPARAGNQEALCEVLPVKENFVGADYVPGVDVNGNPVVPADVKASANDILDVVKFPVTVDLAQQLNQQLPPGTEMDAPVAMIEVHKNSTVTYNGQDMTAEVYALCDKEPFNIEAANTAPEPVTPVPGPKPAAKEEIIWGEGH